MNIIFRLALVFGILLLIDFYAFQSVRTLFDSTAASRIIRWGWWLLTVAYFAVTIGAIALASATGKPGQYGFMWIATIGLILYLPKIFMLVPLIIEDVYRLGKFLAVKSDLISSPSGEGISRSEFIGKLALGIGAIPFLGLSYGVLRGRFTYRIREENILVPDLPDVFEGTKIVQISDLHSGSFGSPSNISDAIDIVNEQKPDMVFFTGDLVNNEAKELDGFEEVYSKIKAKERVFSILGNHDYGDYVTFESEEAKQENFRDLLNRQKSYGWDLLRNENRIIEREGKKLAVIGVENWSASPRFRSDGDLEKARKGTEDAEVKLLLSHDPSHWDAEVVKKYPDINATFSGHTHGAQFGIDIPGFRWSPARWMYRQWMGMYRNGHQQLYVNPGLGYIGYMGRLGIAPEITVFQLKKA